MIRLLLLLVFCVIGIHRAGAQDWPIKPIKFVVPLAAGAGTDLIGRAVSEKLYASLGQPVILENRPGAGGTIAADLVSRAAPDGYTLLLGNSATNGIVKFLIKNLPYDPIDGFTPVTNAVELPIALVVNNSLPVNSVAEFIAYARKYPGKLSFGSSGYGTSHHLAGELLKQRAGIDIVHVPYKGGAPAMVDLLAGQIPALFTTLSTVVPHMSAGTVKVLGMVERTRSRLHPEIPTIGETVPDYAMPPTWMGFLGPPKMPDALTLKMNAEFVKAINTPDVRDFLLRNGFEVQSGSSEEFGRQMRASLKRFEGIAASAHIIPQ